MPYRRPPLWSSGQTSWLQIQRVGFNSWRYQIFREVVGLERGLLSLVITIEEPLERKSSGSGLESREYDRKNPSRWPCGTLYPQTLALTSPTSCGRSVGIDRSRTQATEFSFLCCVAGYETLNRTLFGFRWKLGDRKWSEEHCDLSVIRWSMCILRIVWQCRNCEA
jgi:hypothetical protein